MILKDELLWRYDPANIDQAYEVAEDAVALAVQALRVLDYTDKSKRWLHQKERRELTALWVSALKLVDALGTYDKPLVGASPEEIKAFVDAFISNKQEEPVK